MLHPPPSQASGGDRCFLRACYFRLLHDLYICASLVVELCVTDKLKITCVLRLWYLLAHVE